uniref:ATPase component of various ABC-type transport systems with duplicated ATPase domain n=1 Tax=Eubacterium cellulosolvens (strain ATCC 43171 / JCM 9499 / 6) TaxID=633697 RepID=I5AX25_EUBC6
MKDRIIEIKQVSFRYKGSEMGLLKDMSLNVCRGETLLLTGASGSGKTTILRLINGLIPHYYQGELEGSVTVTGRDIRNTELYELAGVVGTVFQNPRSQFFSVDTDGEIVFGPENIGLDPEKIRQRKDAVVREMHLEKLLGRSLFELSGGEKQRIACASVSALLPDIILLDEPSSNLDQHAIGNLRQEIIRWKEQGKTILISEHRLWYLKDLVDRVIYMEKGRICREWSGVDFSSLDRENIRKLKLRPLSVPELLASDRETGADIRCAGGTEVSDTRSACTSEVVREKSNGIVLRDFYYSYHRRPYLFRKRQFKKEDTDLSLRIPYLALPKNSVIGVIGENGTGKSTFLKCVCGLEKDCRGSVEIDGKAYRGKERLGICYMVMQDVNHQLFTDSVEDEVLLSMKEEDRERCREILETLGILEYKDKHPMALSGGQKQRVAIASAVAADAKLMLFDEPTSGLDFCHMEKVGELLKKLAEAGNTVLVVTHDPELVELCCDYVMRIEDGEVTAMQNTGNLFR